MHVINSLYIIESILLQIVRKEQKSPIHLNKGSLTLKFLVNPQIAHLRKYLPSPTFVLKRAFPQLS
jgi:hypothetical protein